MKSEPPGRTRKPLAHTGFPRKSTVVAAATLLLAWLGLQADIDRAKILLGMTAEVAARSSQRCRCRTSMRLPSITAAMCRRAGPISPTTGNSSLTRLTPTRTSLHGCVICGDFRCYSARSFRVLGKLPDTRIALGSRRDG